MPFTSAIPVAESAIGVAIESSRGVAVQPQYFVPVMNPKYEPMLTFLPDQTLQGSMVSFYDEVPSLRHDTEAWDSYPYLDTFPVIVRSILGSPDTVTAARAAPTTLSAPATAGASTVTASGVSANSWIVIDTGVGVQETHLVTTVVGTTVTLAYPLYFSHQSGATVKPLTKHQFSLLNNNWAIGNQPPSLTLTDFAGDVWRQMAGSQGNGLNITGAADALVKYTVDYLGPLAVTPSTPVVSYGVQEAPVGWTTTLVINGTLVYECMTWETDLKRNVKPIPAITGTQNYYQFFAAALEATMKMTVIDDTSATWLDVYESGLDCPIDLTFTDVKSGFACNFHSSRAKFTKGSLDRSKDWVEVPLEATLIPSTADALAGGVSPILITIANSQTAPY